jgi:hypothetical protein
MLYKQQKMKSNMSKQMTRVKMNKIPSTSISETAQSTPYQPTHLGKNEQFTQLWQLRCRQPLKPSHHQPIHPYLPPPKHNWLAPSTEHSKCCMVEEVAVEKVAEGVKGWQRTWRTPNTTITPIKCSSASASSSRHASNRKQAQKLL